MRSILLLRSERGSSFAADGSGDTGRAGGEETGSRIRLLAARGSHKSGVDDAAFGRGLVKHAMVVG
jgi:hypothetical protein